VVDKRDNPGSFCPCPGKVTTGGLVWVPGWWPAKAPLLVRRVVVAEALRDCLLVDRAPKGGTPLPRGSRADAQQLRRADHKGDNCEEFALINEFATANDGETVNVNSGGVDTENWVTSLRSRIRSRVLSLFRGSPGIVAAGSLAVLFAAGYLLAAPMGRDLSAQIAHAQLAEQHWPAVLNLRWYGGFDPLGYSVLSPPVMALLGVRLTTALAYVVSVVLFAALLKGTTVARPAAGAIVGAVCLTGNLVTTRTTFELGLAVGLGALVALALGRLRVASGLSVLAALSSPVAGLFLGVAGGALFLSGRRRGGVTLGVSALVPTIAVGMAFGNGGYQTFGQNHALMGFLICLAVAGLCWRRPAVRWGALLSAGLVVAAYLLPTPVGTNANRLPELFAAPIIVAVATVPLVAVIAAIASVLLLPPVSITEMRERGDPALSAEFYAPLLEQLVARGVSGPIEVVPTLRRGEAAAVAPVVAIARGWSRQVDTGRNPLFYDGTLNADTYRKWLDDNAISYVAISNGPHEWAATDEATLVGRGLPYLQAVWSDRTWTLYAVTNPRPVISLPGQVTARDGVSLTVSLPEPGEYVVRVHWSRYLSASNGCVRPAEDEWSIVVVDHPATVKIEGSLTPRHC
jgi:hypothetical protein